MTLKEDIVKALEALNPKTEPTRAKLENDPSARSISLLLKSSAGLCLLEHIIQRVEGGKEGIISMDKWVEKEQLIDVIEFQYCHNNIEEMNTLLQAYYGIWIAQGGDDAGKNGFEAVLALADSSAVENVELLFTICVDCKTKLSGKDAECPSCRGKNLISISELSLQESAVAVLINRQFLELYVKECMADAGIDVVAWHDSSCVDTSISVGYQVEGEMVEPDVIGITKPTGILVCEAKTSKRIKPNDIRKISEPLRRLAEKVREYTGKELSQRFLLVTTGYFDKNVRPASMVRKGWELIDRSGIQTLKDELVRIQREL